MIKLVLIVSAVMVISIVMAFPTQQDAEIPVRVVRAADPDPGHQHHRGHGYGGGYGGGHGGHGGHRGHGGYSHYNHGGRYNGYRRGHSHLDSSANAASVSGPLGSASFASSNANAGTGGFGYGI